MSKPSSPPENGPARIVNEVNGSELVQPKNVPWMPPSDVLTSSWPPKGNVALREKLRDRKPLAIAAC